MCERIEYPDGAMEAYPLSRAVGNPRAQGPALIVQIEVSA